MKFNYLILIGIGIGIGYLLATDDKEEILNDIKDGLSKGKDFVTSKLKKTVGDMSENFASKEN
jgi:hypothetical protein